MTPLTFRSRSGLVFALLLLASVCAAPLHAQSTSPTGTLTVRVDGLDSDEGNVRIALNNRQNYDADGNVRAASLLIEDGTAQWTATDVPHGTYAVRVHHDENGNGEMDTNMFGVPQEAFGFSNNVRGTLGPPDFEKAAFRLKSDSLAITITAE
jgi:uncharacterized protein (DUF2141 family)